MSELTQEFTDQLYANYQANVKFAALENAITHNGIHAALETRKSAVENTPVFSLDLTKDKVTDQKASGRCWMFAALNTFRHKMIASFQLEDFELSQLIPSSGTSTKIQLVLGTNHCDSGPGLDQSQGGLPPSNPSTRWWSMGYGRFPFENMGSYPSLSIQNPSHLAIAGSSIPT